MSLLSNATRWVPAAQRVATRRRMSVGPTDILAVLALNALLIAAMWLRHGGLDLLGSFDGILTAAGQLTALFGTYAALIGVVLLARMPWLEQTVGSDRLVGWHRWVGFATVWLIVGHAVLTTAGWAATAGVGIVDEASSLLMSEQYVFMATVGFAFFVIVAISSMRWARARLSYETWYGIHLYGYLAVALGFMHAVVIGTDFVADPLARAYWLALYVVAFGLMLVYRVGGPVRLNLRHRFVVAHVAQEATGVVSVFIAGRDLDRLDARAGQFFRWRFLTGGGWWRAHPYSLSAAPGERYLRITIKDSGIDSHLAQSLRPGTRVFAEGPYGAFTADLLERPGAVFIAGGIGITPLRGMLDELPPDHGPITLIYRATTWGEVAFRKELDTIAPRRGVQVVYVIGRRSDPRFGGDPLRPEAMAGMVPDIADRDIFVGGSTAFISHVRRSLRQLGVQGGQVHAEQFAF